jgi:hypothetical protein
MQSIRTRLEMLPLLAIVSLGASSLARAENKVEAPKASLSASCPPKTDSRFLAAWTKALPGVTVKLAEDKPLRCDGKPGEAHFENTRIEWTPAEQKNLHISFLGKGTFTEHGIDLDWFPVEELPNAAQKLIKEDIGEKLLAQGELFCLATNANAGKKVLALHCSTRPLRGEELPAGTLRDEFIYAFPTNHKTPVLVGFSLPVEVVPRIGLWQLALGAKSVQSLMASYSAVRVDFAGKQIAVHPSQGDARVVVDFDAEGNLVGTTSFP